MSRRSNDRRLQRRAVDEVDPWRQEPSLLFALTFQVLGRPAKSRSSFTRPQPVGVLFLGPCGRRVDAVSPSVGFHAVRRGAPSLRSCCFGALLRWEKPLELLAARAFSVWGP